MLRADRLGDRVPAHARGWTHSVFERACNIETRSGELVTVLAEGLGNVPHGIRLASPAAPFTARLSRGQSVIIESTKLRIPEAGFTVDFSGAAVWSGTVAAVSLNACGVEPAAHGAGNVAGDISAALHALRATLFEQTPEQGFAPLLIRPCSARSPLERALALRLARTLPALARATRIHDANAATVSAAQLVGLGEGLTPSGDDFLVGYLAALRSRSSLEDGIEALLQSLARSLGPLLLRTNAISRQMLNDALQGYFGECLVDVVRAISRTGHVVNATGRALQSGHSSGADTLCGLLFGYSPALAMQEAHSLADYSPIQEFPRAVQFESNAGRTVAIA